MEKYLDQNSTTAASSEAASKSLRVHSWGSCIRRGMEPGSISLGGSAEIMWFSIVNQEGAKLLFQNDMLKLIVSRAPA